MTSKLKVQVRRIGWRPVMFGVLMLAAVPLYAQGGDPFESFISAMMAVLEGPLVELMAVLGAFYCGYQLIWGGAHKGWYFSGLLGMIIILKLPAFVGWLRG